MKRVWLTFKLLESILSLCCLGCYIRGFLNNDYIQDHYICAAVFGGFSLMAMFGCLSICTTNEKVEPYREGFFNVFAAVAFISVSMNSMNLADKYLKADESGQLQKIFRYAKTQSVAALWCGSIFLLHSIFAFDFAIFEKSRDMDDSDDDEDDNDYVQPLFLYVFGKKVHGWLEKFEYFSTLADNKKRFTREELLNKIRMGDM